LISPEVKKFLNFRNKLIELLDNSFDVYIDENDSSCLSGDSKEVADRIIKLIEEYEDNHEVQEM
jgi:hypothetical protein